MSKFLFKQVFLKSLYKMSTFIYKTFTISLFLILWVILCMSDEEAQDYDAIMERIEPIGKNNEDAVWKFDGLRVKRYNKSIYIIQGKLFIVKDIGDEYKIMINTYHSSKGNNQYQKNAMKVGEQGMCEWAAKTYKVYLMDDLKGISNLPNFEESYCPWKKGEYSVQNYVLNKGRFPSHINPGIWKIEILITHEEKVNSGLVLYVRIESKSPK